MPTLRDGMKDKVIGYRTDFPSNMFSWVAGLNYDYRTSNDKFLELFQRQVLLLLDENADGKCPGKDSRGYRHTQE